ncbi:MAG: hypothetical protein WD960_03775 [Gemmatimonadota bacterium]
MTPNRRERRRTRKGPPRESGGPDPLLRLEPLHFGLLAAWAIVGVAGYWFLDQGSISAAPILLAFAYLIILPLALVLPARGGRAKDGEPTDQGRGPGASRR